MAHDPTVEIKEVLSPDYRKMFTFALASFTVIGVIILMLLWSIGTAGNFVETHARAVWAEAMIKTQSQAMVHETTLGDHDKRLKALEQQGQETSGRLIKMDGKLDQISSAVQELKDQKRR